MAQATFYFDLGSPFAYLAAERVDEALLGPVAFQPVSLGGLFKLNGRSSWSLGDPERRSSGMAEVGRRAERYGLAPIRWPDPWPSNYLFAMRAATYAQQRGALREFTRCAFRRAFADGVDLGAPENVLQVAFEVGFDPQELKDAAAEPQLKLSLRSATEQAHAIGVFGVPTVAIAGELFWGDDRLAEAAEAQRLHR